VVWINILRSDDRYSAYLRSTEFDDPRVKYYWDPIAITGVEWQETLGIDQLAWDIYFLYGKDAGWRDIPDTPDLWMHQLGNLQDRAPFLDEDLLKTSMKKLVDRD
jgi:hypothetical protein